MTIDKKNCLNNSQVGFAAHRMIYSDEGIPVDYEFLEVNDAFLIMTGFPDTIVGKTLLEIVPNIKSDKVDWIQLYGDVATTNLHLTLENYSETLSNWYVINAFSPQKGYFNVVLTPTPTGTTSILSNSELKLNYYRNEGLLKVMSHNYDDMNDFLDYALLEAIKITRSDIGYIYFYDEETQVFTLNSWSNKVMDQCTVTEKQTIYMLEKTGFWGEAVRQKKAIINNNFMAHHPLKKGLPQGHAVLNNFFTLPIYDKGRIVAVIGLGNKIDDYDQNDVLLIQSFMEEVWTISKRKQAEEELEKERAYLKITLESIKEGILSVNQDNIIFAVNRSAETFIGKAASDIINAPIGQILMELNPAIGRKFDDLYLDETLISASQLNETFEVLNNTLGMSLQLTTSPLFDDENRKQGYVVVLRDVTKEQADSEKIRYMSYHDALTGLYNRRFFEEELTRLDTKRQFPLGIIMGDVNGLKLTNDAFGHLKGDALLIAAAEILSEACRKEDIIARWGGDEFILLLPQTPEERCLEICQQIREKCESVDDMIVSVSLSLGYAVKIDESEDVRVTLTKAEDLMYKSKLSETSSQRSHIIETIKNTLYERNHETEEHGQRLIEYSLKIGQTLGLSNDDLSDLKLLSILHDIGKIGIADAILLKPGPLTKDEWLEMKKHPLIGFRIAQSSVDLQQISKYILHHHEHYDGHGYPNGLKGLEIPLLSRIIAIADAFDAMTSDRPYKKAFSPEIAAEELRKCSGTQFDPELVNIFLNGLE